MDPNRNPMLRTEELPHQTWTIHFIRWAPEGGREILTGKIVIIETLKVSRSSMEKGRGGVTCRGNSCRIVYPYFYYYLCFRSCLTIASYSVPEWLLFGIWACDILFEISLYDQYMFSDVSIAYIVFKKDFCISCIEYKDA